MSYKINRQLLIGLNEKIFSVNSLQSYVYEWLVGRVVIKGTDKIYFNFIELLCWKCSNKSKLIVVNLSTVPFVTFNLICGFEYLIGFIGSSVKIWNLIVNTKQTDDAPHHEHAMWRSFKLPPAKSIRNGRWSTCNLRSHISKPFEIILLKQIETLSCCLIDDG